MATFSDFLHAILAGPAIKKIFNIDADELIQRLRDEHPGATQNEIVKLFYKAVREMDSEEQVDFEEASIMYLGFNTLGAQIKRERGNSPYWKNQREQKQNAGDEFVRENVRKIKENIIAAWVCPNGIAVRDNTFGYIRSLGGILGRIANAGDDDAVIRDVLSDSQIEKLFQGKRGRKVA